MPPRIILLAGAPAPSALDEDQCTVQSFQEPFHDFIDDDDDAAEPRGPGSSFSPPARIIAPWRSLSLHPKPLRTGLTQARSFFPEQSLLRHRPHDDFFCPPSLASSCDHGRTTHDEEEEEEEEECALAAEFCERSLAIHNDDDSLVPSSSPLAEGETSTSLVGEETFFRSASTPTPSDQPRSPPPPPPLAVPTPGHLSDLEDVPSARQVAALQPQTVTVNLIAGVLSVAAPRAVTTRWGATLSLVEVLLGDDTRSGFAVTFWLSGEAVPAPAALLLGPGGVRRQDVVLLQNVALHVFRGKVYGQSLRGGRTKVHLLWSRRKGAGACYSSRALEGADGMGNPQMVKTRLVRDWMLQFVGADPAIKGASNQDVWDRPPQDTQ